MMLMSTFQFISLLTLVILSLGFKAPFGKKFVYKYESLVATGVVDKVISQAAGFGLKATVAVQWQLEHASVYFKLSNVTFAEFNKKTTNIFQLWDLPEPTTSLEIEEYIKELEEPFWISAGPGETVNIEHGNRWEKTANFKLSLAALFQIIVRRDSDVYIEMEEGIIGRCPVIYRLAMGTDDPNTHDRSLNISKVVLYDKCESRQHRLRFSISGYKCNQCDELTQPLKSLGKTNYQIRVNRMDDGTDSMSFEKIDANGAIIFTPFGPDGNTVLSLTNQTLTLVSATDEVDEHPSGLIAEPAVGFVFPHNPTESNNALLEAERKLSDMIKVFATFDTQSITIMEFVLLFREFSFNDLAYFFTQHVNFNISSSSVREGEIRIALLQALSNTGTEASAQYVMHLTSEKNISRHLAAELIRIVPFHLHKPSHQFLANFSSFVHSYEINQFKDALQEAVWLSLGTVIKKTCIVESIPSIQTEKLDFARLKECNFYVESLTSDFILNTDVKIQQLILRTIQNTHLPAVTHFSLSILKSEMDISLRKTSIWGVIGSTDRTTKLEVISTVMQIAFNSTEYFTLRLYAFEALIYLNPTPEVFSLLVDYMNKETNQQISSYIYSALVTMANTSDPCSQALSKLAKETLRYIQPRRYDTLRFSKNKVLSYYNDKYKFGRTFQFAYFASNESIFPKEIYVGQFLNLFGYNFNFQEMIFHTGDVDTYLSRYFDTEKQTEKRENNDFLNTLYKLLPKRKRGNVNAISKFITKYFGQDVSSSAPFGNDAAHCLHEKNKFSQDEKGAHNDVLMRCIKFSFMDMQLTLANDMGFLTTLQLHVPLVYKMGFRAVTNITALKVNANATGDFHFKFGSNFIVKTSMFVESPLKKRYGYTLKTHAGVKVSLVVNSAELNNVEFENYQKHLLSFLYYPTKGVYPTSNPYTMLFYKTSPETFAHTNILKYPSNKNEKEGHYSYGRNYFGVGLTFNYSYNPLWPDFLSYSHLKSFFHKGIEQNDYFEGSDKLFSGIMGFYDFLTLNPNGKPFDFSINFNQRTTDQFAIDSSFTKRVDPHGNDLKVVKKFYLDVQERGEVISKWLLKCKHTSVNNYDYLLIEFDHTLPNDKSSNNQNLFAIRLELNQETSDFTQILIDPVSNPDKTLRRFYNVSIKAGSTFQSLNWLKMDIEGVGSRDDVYKVDDSILNRCSNDRDKGFEYSFVCWLLKKQRGRLHNFYFTIYHEEESQNIRLNFLRLFIWSLHQMHNNLEIDLNTEISDPNQTQVNFNFSNISPHVDISITRNDETYKLSDVYIPSLIPHFEHITVINSETERLLENALYIHQPKCIISGDYIQTTDRIIYQFPMGPCYHVVFANCHSNRVIILMNQSTSGNKALRVYFESIHRIDIENNMVKINQVEELLNRSWYTFNRIEDTISREIFTVTKHGTQVDIDATQYFGVHITFDGKNAVISVTNWLRGLQCGLCGNFDGEKSNEFIRSDGMQTANATDFALSYEVREENCN